MANAIRICNRPILLLIEGGLALAVALAKGGCE